MALVSRHFPLLPGTMNMDVRSGFLDSIGNTPLIRLKARLRGHGLRDPRQGRVPQSRRLGEGPRRAGHRRATPRQRGLLRPGGVIVEGTAGNTGIGLALVGNARGLSHGDRDARDAEPGEEGHAAAVRRRPAPGAAPCPTPIPATTCGIPAGWPRSWQRASPNGAIWANQFDNVANRDGPLPDHRPGDLGADRRQGRRLHLRRGHAAARWPASRWR